MKPVREYWYCSLSRDTKETYTAGFSGVGCLHAWLNMLASAVFLTVWLVIFYINFMQLLFFFGVISVILVYHLMKYQGQQRGFGVITS